MSIDLQAANDSLRGNSPQEIIAWALSLPGKPLVTTNFSPYEAVILHMATQVKPDIEVLWVDSGYALRPTYEFAKATIEKLNLNMQIVTPTMTAEYYNVAHGGIPTIDEEEAHNRFTEIFKLEPFKRGLDELNPDVWLTAVRKDQTAFRQDMETVSEGPNGVIKVAPLLEWTEADMQAYIEANDLPNELKYFDPTKAEFGRECGLHTKL